MAPREVQPPKTTAEIGPRRAAAKKVRDDLKTALGQEGLTDKEYNAIQAEYEKAKDQYNLLDDLYGKAEKDEKKAKVSL
jgi:5-bromo-4-chloroindolyl phosphate hydrolysis protein